MVCHFSISVRVFFALLSVGSIQDRFTCFMAEQLISSQSSCNVLRSVIDSISESYHLSCNYRLLRFFSSWWRSTVSDLETLQFHVYLPLSPPPLFFFPFLSSLHPKLLLFKFISHLSLFLWFTARVSLSLSSRCSV